MELRYVGRAPDSDFSVVHKKWVDDRYAQVRVDLAYVNAQVDLVTPTLATPAYVDTQDAQRATKVAVDAADTNYLLLTQKGQPNGVATIGSDGYITPGQLPALTTQRNPRFQAGVVSSGFTGPKPVSSTSNYKEFTAATLSIADPGFSYIPLVFVNIQGGATQGAKGMRALGTGTYGRITVAGPDDKVYGYGVGTDHKTLAYQVALPYGDSGDNDSPYEVNGSLDLTLYLSALTVSSTGATAYVFTPTDMQFYALIYPSF